MSFIPSVLIMKQWLDLESITEEKKLKILTGLTSYTAVLRGATCEQTGTLRFSADGVLLGIGPEIPVSCDKAYETEGDFYPLERPVCLMLEQ